MTAPANADEWVTCPWCRRRVALSEYWQRELRADTLILAWHRVNGQRCPGTWRDPAKRAQCPHCEQWLPLTPTLDTGTPVLIGHRARHRDRTNCPGSYQPAGVGQ